MLSMKGKHLPLDEALTGTFGSSTFTLNKKGITVDKVKA